MNRLLTPSPATTDARTLTILLASLVVALTMPMAGCSSDSGGGGGTVGGNDAGGNAADAAGGGGSDAGAGGATDTTGDESDVGGGESDTAAAADMGGGAEDAGGGEADAGAVTDAGGEADAGGNEDAGAPAVSFSDVYATIFQTNGCVGCHANKFATESMAYDSLMNGSYCGSDYVVAGEPSQSAIYFKLVAGEPLSCGKKMPQGSSGISGDAAELLGAWILGGAQP